MPASRRPDRTASRAEAGTDNARLLALDLLCAVLVDGQMLADLPSPAAPAPIRARARRLVLATLRELPRADAVLNPLLRKPPPARLHALLRLAVTEMLALGAPAHGVVHDGVALARAGGSERLSGMVNAVLRRAADFGAAEWAALPVPRLPGWLRRRLAKAYGKDAVAAIEAAHLAGAPLDLTPRPAGEGEVAKLVAALETATGGAVQRLPGGSLRLQGGAQVSALPGHDEGHWWVQDAAAALPALLLAPKAGERVLDLCAAPGGKTMQLAAAGAHVTALDRSGRRLERLRENLARTGLAAQEVCADALEWAPGEGGLFDAVLLDAPCTATGTIRRHPELPLIRKPGDIEALTALQAQLIDRAAALLRPGGRLVYCTCSLLQEEGEAQLEAALARNPALTPADYPALPLGRPAPGGGWRTRPDELAGQGGLDGFFMALLRKS
ncbi:MAG: methyltransferase domain-containing protein [Pararhodobacter sp.]|nr:methyltransferase domain-containing protein [Pararhodobacter sp.]